MTASRVAARAKPRLCRSGEIDVIVHGEFDDAAALARYKAHPIYQETIGVVRPLREVRIAVDYEVPDR